MGPLAIAPFLGMLLFTQTPPNVHDSVLITFWLSPDQEAQFDGSDGQMSAFWSQWAQRDSILLTPATNAHPDDTMWDGPGDASVVCKAAGGVKGLYVQVSVDDDSVVYDEDRYAGDYLSMYHDTLTAQALEECQICHTGGYAAGFTYLTKQLLFSPPPPGTDADPTLLLMYDYLYWCGVCRFAITPETANAMGATVEMLAQPPKGLCVEYRIPWSFVQSGSIEVLEGHSSSYDVVPAAGTRRAFTVSYTDRDSVGTESQELAWLRMSPWYGFYWGEMQFDDGFPIVPTRADSLRASQASIQHVPGTATRRSDQSVYSLDGRTIASKHLWQTDVLVSADGRLVLRAASRAP
jgi:hypothetical protein